jgi:hypothetical protein
MRVLNVVLIGAVLGALDGVGIFFEPRERYNWEIFCAATLKGILSAILTAFSLAVTMRWWAAAGVGMFYGLVLALVVYLAKGGLRSGDAPYVVPSGIVTGAITGILILKWGL